MSTGTRNPSTAATGGIRWARIVVLACGAATVYLLGRVISDALVDQFDLHLRASNEPLLHRAIMTATMAYVVLMAIPFMPAVEIGLSMLLIFGARIAFLVYVSTVTALVLSYCVGRLLPMEITARAFGLLGLARARALVQRMAPLPAEERAALIVRESPTPMTPMILRHRFLTLALLFNLPGNVLIGGGGGIALVAGMCRLFPLHYYLLTVACAVAPVPLIIFLTERL